jgi:hypothetical protein
MNITISLDDRPQADEVLALYRVNSRSAFIKSEQLIAELEKAQAVVTARVDGRLVGLGCAMLDGTLIVYHPHLLVHPDCQGKDVDKKMMHALQAQYSIFHQQMLAADAEAGKAQAMWIYGA